MWSKIDRVGEEGINTFGSKMVIMEYRMRRDIDVYFPEYDWIVKNVQYNNFKNGSIVCPYEKRVFGVGYLGEGEYKVKENGKKTKCYGIWHGILQRCYDSKYHEKRPTYIDCKVCDEWLCYTNFGDWFTDNYYEAEGERTCLDKDILHKGNKIYSPENCVFVPERINTLFVKSDKKRGEYPIGAYYNKEHKKFRAQCSIYDFKENKKKQIYLGYYDTPEKAFEVYKKYKENHIREVADYYKGKVPNKLYDAMYKYEVNIDD